MSIVTLLVLSGLAVALPKLQQTNEAQAYNPSLENIDEYLAIDSSSVGQLELNLSDFAGQEVAYIKDTITVNEAVEEPHTVHFKITPTSWVPFSEAFVYTTDDPTSADATWQPVTTDRIAAVGAETATNGKTYNIYYGVRLGEIPAGTYSVDINYDTLVDFDGTMQAMNQKICQRLPLETNVVLRDVRDDNYYTIMRAADDSCWMMEDLRLVLSTKKALTSADTDLNTKDSWRPGIGTGYEYYDEEDDEWYYYADSSMQTLLNDPCENASDWRACAFNENSSWVYDDEGVVWYNLSAAIVSSLSYDDILDRIDRYGEYVAEDSICPKGWQIPVDAHFDSLSSNGMAHYSKLKLGYNHPFFLPSEMVWGNGRILMQTYGSEGYYGGFSFTDYHETAVRCVLSYSGEATLTLDGNIQTAETSRMGAEFMVPRSLPTNFNPDFRGYVAVNPEGFYIYNRYDNDGTFYVKVYEPGETYTFYAPHTVLYPVFVDSSGYLYTPKEEEPKPFRP